MSSTPTDEPRPSGNTWFPDIPRILPHEKVYPIQIGSELFRLSGASLSSDAPSYFSQFFQRQLSTSEEGAPLRTLYIDRDPYTFRDIARHLQGYHIAPRDGPHFVRLFADAQFYSLPKLISQLFASEIYISIGGAHFQINRDLFSSPGNSPNYFTLGFAVFFSNPSEIFPGLNREGLLRPPSILPPEVPNRSAKVFAELIELLRGYPVKIRDETHRQELLRDCRYFHFKGLEQRLLPVDISYNPVRKRQEIVMRLEDIKPSGIAFAEETAASTQQFQAMSPPSTAPQQMGYITYTRPFIDEIARELIIELSSGETCKLHLDLHLAEFSGQANSRIHALLSVISNKLQLPSENLGLKMLGTGLASTPPSEGGRRSALSEEKVKIEIGSDAAVILNGEDWEGDFDRSSGGFGGNIGIGGAFGGGIDDGHFGLGELGLDRKRKRVDEVGKSRIWYVKRAQWRIRIQPREGGLEAVLCGVKIEAVTGERGRNKRRGFLV
ncbi:hypothetical protein BZA77DRAFT_250771 [Pyronema omphalodes]|nr:hypothetical protein BZA77DRAFT_250771 [Pyronema omphalodes]